MILFGTPTWARVQADSFCGPIRPDKYPAFARFARTMAEYFKQAPWNVHRWEVWNEPDAPVFATRNMPFGCWGRPDQADFGGGEYGRMLRQVYPAIKAGDPGATVALGGLLMGCEADGKACPEAEQPGLKFLRGVLAAEAGDSFDVVGYHAYAYWSDEGQDWDRKAHGWEDKGGVVLGKLAGLRAVLGDLDKPIEMNEGALLWCDPDDPRTWCHKQGIRTPGAAYKADQASSVTRLYTRAWANGLRSASWFYMENGGWRGSGLLDEGPAQTPRPGYQALRTLTTALKGATYAGGTVTNGRAETAPFEDYRFCTGNVEHRLLWTADADDTVRVQLPRGTTAVTDELGAAAAAADPLPVGFRPTIVRRELDHPCGGPAITELTMRQHGDRLRETAYASATGDGPGAVWTRDAGNAAGTSWPSAWRRQSFAEAWGTGGPPVGRIDAVTSWKDPGAAAWTEAVFAGDAVWTRASDDAAGLDWDGDWTRTSLQDAWGGHVNHPPVDRVDAVSVRTDGVTRQTVVAGDKTWYRDAGDGGWPAAWQGPATLASLWGGHVNHPPVDRVDSLSVRPAPGGHKRQVVVSGETMWWRDSTDAAGTAWPGTWDSRTLAAAWGAGTTAAGRPPVYATAISDLPPAPQPSPQPSPRPTPGPVPAPDRPAPAGPPPASPGPVSALGDLPFTGSETRTLALGALALLAGGVAVVVVSARRRRRRS